MTFVFCIFRILPLHGVYFIFASCYTFFDWGVYTPPSGHKYFIVLNYNMFKL